MVVTGEKYEEVWEQIDSRLTLAPGFPLAFNMFRHGRTSRERHGMYVANLSCTSPEDALAIGHVYGLRPENWLNGQVLIDVQGLRPLIGDELVDRLVEIKAEEESAQKEMYAGLDIRGMINAGKTNGRRLARIG